MFSRDYSKYGLPAFGIAEEVNASLRENCRLVLTAAPGAGKSTLIPLTVIEGLDEGKVIMLEPRRLAARQIAGRMAEMLGEKPGETVGYRIRFETRVSQKTRIEVVTEGILTRMLIEDPTLDGVSVLIFDEFHERSINCDLALALSLECQQVLRPDLRIMLMSATIGDTTISKTFDAPRLEAEGRMFPVELRRYPLEAKQDNVSELVAKAIREVHCREQGDILAFLPGEGEIRRCAGHLGTFSDGTKVFPLYGMLPFEEQRKAITPGNCRRIVLATPVAETSLTIDGVRVVIDSGLCKKLVYDPQTSLSRLETVRISKDMADQRKGRAGRTAPGICYRLWSLATEMAMAEYRVPEILDSDLSDVVLSVSAWGGSDVSSLPWLTPPPAASLSHAHELLVSLGALDSEGSLTKVGRKMASMPCHPRLARMLVSAEDDAAKALAADLAAILEDRDPLARATDSSDISLRVSRLRSSRRNGRVEWPSIERASSQYRHMLHVDAENTDPDPFEIGALTALAYPERIAREISSGRYQLSGGDIALLGHGDMVAHEWLALASLSSAAGREGRILLAAPVAFDDLLALARPYDNLSWDSREGRVVSRRELRIGRLVLKSQELHDVDKQAFEKVMCNAVKKDGVSLLDFNDDVNSLQRRLACAAAWHPELELPDCSTGAVLSRTDEWLPLWLGDACTRDSLKRLDMCAVLWNMLDYAQQQAVDSIAPTHMEVPTGSRIRLDYRQGSEAPVLRVRLQECFGLTATPCVDGGRVPVLMELLSPGFKPVQLTTDLESFWSGTYFEVRKELRRRYPKHSWPDDPLIAPPKRGVKK